MRIADAVAVPTSDNRVMLMQILLITVFSIFTPSSYCTIRTKFFSEFVWKNLTKFFQIQFISIYFLAHKNQIFFIYIFNNFFKLF
jgi:hypothetical protein